MKITHALVFVSGILAAAPRCTVAKESLNPKLPISVISEKTEFRPSP